MHALSAMPRGPPPPASRPRRACRQFCAPVGAGCRLRRGMVALPHLPHSIDYGLHPGVGASAYPTRLTQRLFFPTPTAAPPLSPHHCTSLYTASHAGTPCHGAYTCLCLATTSAPRHSRVPPCLSVAPWDGRRRRHTVTLPPPLYAPCCLMPLLKFEPPLFVTFSFCINYSRRTRSAHFATRQPGPYHHHPSRTHHAHAFAATSAPARDFLQLNRCTFSAMFHRTFSPPAMIVFWAGFSVPSKQPAHYCRLPPYIPPNTLLRFPTELGAVDGITY